MYTRNKAVAAARGVEINNIDKPDWLQSASDSVVTPTRCINVRIVTTTMLYARLTLTQTHFVTLTMYMYPQFTLGLPTVQDSPGPTQNWPTVSRVPGKVDVVPELFNKISQYF